MVKIKQGDILKANENIVVHQVNVQGIMGGGVARQLASHYTGLEKEYSEFCKIYDNDYNKLKGKVFKIMIDGKFIMNMFSQKENFDTDYEAMKIALEEIKEYARGFKLSIAIPYRYWLWNSEWRLEQSL